jgi:YD repeat-containing protein
MTEFVYTDSNNGNSTSSKIEYDKLGNLTKRTNLNNNGSVKELIECKNIYDEKGNIIVREKYLNEKIMEKTIYDITYW